MTKDGWQVNKQLTVWRMSVVTERFRISMPGSILLLVGLGVGVVLGQLGQATTEPPLAFSSGFDPSRLDADRNASAEGRRLVNSHEKNRGDVGRLNQQLVLETEQARAEFARLEKELRSQPPDEVWKMSLAQALASGEMMALGLKKGTVECGSTLCKISYHLDERQQRTVENVIRQRNLGSLGIQIILAIGDLGTHGMTIIGPDGRNFDTIVRHPQKGIVHQLSR